MTQTIGDKRKILKYGWTGLLIAAFIVLIAIFFYLDRRNELSVIIRAWGCGGCLCNLLDGSDMHDSNAFGRTGGIVP